MTSATPGEATTRKELIDPALEKAGWDLGNPDQVGIEIPVDGFDPAAWHALELQLRESRVPYTCLLYTSPSPRYRTRSRMPSSA